MSNRCPRSWEVEADMDGRLLPSAKPSLERHEATCDECRRERAAFERLERISEYGADAAGEELALRRLRVRTLEEAARIVEAKSNGLSVRWTFVAALSFLLIVGSLSLLRSGALWPSAPQVARVSAHGAAHWTRELRDGRERIALQSGELVVEHGSDMAALTVALPDGEIDDIGTVFRVSVSDGHTRRISVAQGAVVFRKHGDKPMRIDAPGVWNEPAAAPAPPTRAASVEPAAPLPEPAKAVSPARTQHAAKHSGARDRSNLKASDFTDEDVAYLRVIALLREGRRDEARLAAQHYLQAFPQGLRRKELESIAR